MLCIYIINGCTLDVVVKCGHFISVFIQHFNVANALWSWSLQCLEKVHNLHPKKATRQATTVRFVPLHQPKYLWRLSTVVRGDGQQCEALYNTAVLTSDAKNIRYSSIKYMLWKVNSILKLGKKSTWCSRRFQMDNHKRWFKSSAACRIRSLFTGHFFYTISWL